ncbi:MAG TPA: hypothetical protein VME92_19685 [Acetobacteraceae bacterium]|nr:hypothetical protein [Acetobacteraceae bacterium]
MARTWPVSEIVSPVALRSTVIARTGRIGVAVGAGLLQATSGTATRAAATIANLDMSTAFRVATRRVLLTSGGCGH